MPLKSDNRPLQRRLHPNFESSRAKNGISRKKVNPSWYALPLGFPPCALNETANDCLPRLTVAGVRARPEYSASSPVARPSGETRGSARLVSSVAKRVQHKGGKHRGGKCKRHEATYVPVTGFGCGSKNLGRNHSTRAGSTTKAPASEAAIEIETSNPKKRTGANEETIRTANPTTTDKPLKTIPRPVVVSVRSTGGTMP